MSGEGPTRIVILGGGFGGVYTALAFEKVLGRTGDLEVTLVNRENFFLFTPMLHEVAASDLDMTHIVNPIRKLLRRVKFVEGDVESIDLGRRRVVVAHGSDHHDHELEYDHLVLALGAVTNFYDLPGVEERALTMKSLGDAIGLRNRLIDHLEQADVECCGTERTPLCTFVVAGGGFAGVETVAAVNDFVREALEFYPGLREEHLRVVLVHDGSYLLPELGETLGAYTQAKLAGRKVEIRLRTRMIPHWTLFGWMTLITETFIGVSLVLGLFTRLGALVALGMAANVTVGILSVPHEWGWTYTMLIMLPALFLLTDAGRSFGVDGVLAPALDRAAARGGRVARLLRWLA